MKFALFKNNNLSVFSTLNCTFLFYFDILHIIVKTYLAFKVMKQVLLRPIGPAIGFMSQFLFMPLVAFTLSFIFPPDMPEMRLGLFVTGKCQTIYLFVQVIIILKSLVGEWLERFLAFLGVDGSNLLSASLRCDGLNYPCV